MSAHTPGPWTVGAVGNEVWSPARKGKPVAVTAPSADGLSDARLIAAAPLLLKEAKLAEAFLREQDERNPFAAGLRAAIAMAEGK